MALTGCSLKVAAETWMPYVSFPTGAEQDPAMVSGVAFDAFRIAAERLNVSFELVRPVDGYWGLELDNGSFNGMMGQLLRREVDMAIGPFVHTYERQQAVDFSYPLVIDSFGIFLSRPTLTKDPLNFLKPLSVQVWIWLVISVALSSVVGFFLRSCEKNFEFVEQKVNNFTRGNRGKEKAATAGRLLLAGRVLQGSCLLASLVLSAAYCGALTSQLAAPLIHIPVDSMDDLVATGMDVASEAGSALSQIIRSAESGVMKDIADRMTTVNSCYNSRFDIKAGKLAVLCDYISMRKITGEEFTDNGTCSYYIARERLSKGELSFIFPKNSFYKPYFDQQLRYMVAGGLISHLVNNYISNGTACLVAPGAEPGKQMETVYTVADLGGVFILLMCVIHLDAEVLQQLVLRFYAEVLQQLYDVTPSQLPFWKVFCLQTELVRQKAERVSHPYKEEVGKSLMILSDGLF
ncbi:Ionotropic glutamate receptor L-glutamate and glycine-binding domain [Trinorchestia longiramus]|nr:Ionotropic glutamate receptor L-glutamate and glycine-binding domain [Trinorchestia longiramus]